MDGESVWSEMGRFRCNQHLDFSGDLIVYRRGGEPQYRRQSPVGQLREADDSSRRVMASRFRELLRDRR